MKFNVYRYATWRCTKTKPKRKDWRPLNAKRGANKRSFDRTLWGSRESFISSCRGTRLVWNINIQICLRLRHFYRRSHLSREHGAATTWLDSHWSAILCHTLSLRLLLVFFFYHLHLVFLLGAPTHSVWDVVVVTVVVVDLVDICILCEKSHAQSPIIIITCTHKKNLLTKGRYDPKLSEPSPQTAPTIFEPFARGQNIKLLQLQ